MKPASPHFPLTWNMTAQEMMTPNPHSIREDATVDEAITFLIDKGFRAAPVIDDSGRPVGVVSQSDIVIHDREKVGKAHHEHEYFAMESLASDARARSRARGNVRVRDLMTPVLFTVPPDATFSRVLEELVALKVHRLFVVGDDGILIGVITALDMLRHMYHELKREHTEWLTS